MKKLELVNIITEQIEKENQFIKTMENDKNIQIVSMVNQSLGKIQAYEDILYYAKNNSTLMFKC